MYKDVYGSIVTKNVLPRTQNLLLDMCYQDRLVANKSCNLATGSNNFQMPQEMYAYTMIGNTHG